MSETTITSAVNLMPLWERANTGTVGSQPETGETRHFVERALIDFGLLEAFEHRSLQQRANCLQWIAAASEPTEQEDRVSRLLDALADGGPLGPLSQQR